MTQEEREKLVRIVVNEAHPDKSKEWREARIKDLLGVHAAKPAKKTTPKPARVTDAERKRLEGIHKEINKRIAAVYGIKDPGEIQYR